MLVAAEDEQAAGRLLPIIWDAVDARESTRRRIEMLVVRALLYSTHERCTQATATMARALSLAEPEGYVRLFLDEGAPMLALLEQVKRRGVTPEYTARLIHAFGKSERYVRLGTEALTDPLSEREIEVLRLIATGASSQETAQQLVIASGTVKIHLQNIYGKLRVHTRLQAVQRAKELDLL